MIDLRAEGRIVTKHYVGLIALALILGQQHGLVQGRLERRRTARWSLVAIDLCISEVSLGEIGSELHSRKAILFHWQGDRDAHFGSDEGGIFVVDSVPDRVAGLYLSDHITLLRILEKQGEAADIQ